MAEEKKATIWEALAAVQKAMPVIGKNKEGVHGAKYADLEKVWETLDPILEQNEFTVYHRCDQKSVFTIAHHRPTGEVLDSNIEISQVDPQKKGAEITYYKRYNLGMIFNIIIANEDKDAAGTEVIGDENLAVIEESLKLMNDAEELTNYWKKDLKATTDKKVLALFTKRKKELGL